MIAGYKMTPAEWVNEVMVTPGCVICRKQDASATFFCRDHLRAWRDSDEIDYAVWALRQRITLLLKCVTF